MDEQTTLPEGTLVQCPMKGFALRYVSHCASCEHFKGLAVATQNGEPIDADDVDRYQVICAKPLTRRLQRISKD